LRACITKTSRAESHYAVSTYDLRTPPERQQPDVRKGGAPQAGRASLSFLRGYFAFEQSHPPQLQARLQLQSSPQPQRSTFVSAHGHDVFSHWQGF
jgi:hypothetical protein